jgi:hypothetical protein
MAGPELFEELVVGVGQRRSGTTKKPEIYPALLHTLN